MQNQYKIKWSTDDSKAISNAVRQFNAKRTRLIKRDPLLEQYLPDKLKVSDVRGRIESRADFKREIKSVQRFMKPNAAKLVQSKKGLVVTLYEKLETAYKVRRINRARKRELETLPIDTEHGTMGAVRKNNLQPKQFDFDDMDISEWESFVESVDRQTMPNYANGKQSLYKENFIKGLESIFGDQAEELKKMIRDIDPKQLYEIYYTNPVLRLEFIYGAQERAFRFAALKEELEKYV